MTERGTMTVEGHVGLGEVALRYFERGWCPIELPAGEKAPPPDGRTGRDGRDMTREEVEAATWAGNIGLRMPEDVLGLDVDAYRGGKATYADLVERLGPLPPTSIVHSDRGDGSGTVLFRAQAGMRWVATLAGIDVIQRGHRYLCVPPSVHPDGRIYGVWDQEERAKAELRAVEDLPELPWAWAGYLGRIDEGDRHSVAVGAEEVEAFVSICTEEDAPGYLTVLVAHFEDRRAEGYSRHDTMQHVLIWAMESGRAGLFSAHRALEALGARWVEAVADSPRRAQLGSPARVTEWQAMVRHAIGRAESKTPEEMGRLRDDVVGPRFNVSTSPASHPSAESGPEPGPAASPIWLDWAAFANRDAAGDPWLVEHWWPARRSMALWAEAKTGKSELALWVATQLALGRHPWTGVPAPPVDVAYFDYEMTEDDLDDRLAAFDVEPEDLGRLHYALLPALDGLDVDAGGKEVERLVLDVEARAVIIDTFGRAIVGEEDKADTVRAFYRYTGARLKRHGIAYVRTDHAGKDTSKGQRGSSAKRDDVDIVWRMHRTKDGVLLDCSGSSRVGWVGPALRLDRVQLDRVDLDPVVSYRTPITFDPAARAVIELAAVLDASGIDPALGWRRVRALGIEARNATIGKAQRLRRDREKWPRTPGTAVARLFSDED